MFGIVRCLRGARVGWPMSVREALLVLFALVFKPLFGFLVAGFFQKGIVVIKHFLTEELDVGRDVEYEQRRSTGGDSHDDYPVSHVRASPRKQVSSLLSVCAAASFTCGFDLLARGDVLH